MLYILKKYQLFLKTDTSIKLNFNEFIINIISNNFEDIILDLENDYKTLLNEQFKNKLINSYIKIINDQTNSLLQTVNDLKQDITLKFDHLFSLDIEEVLNETNNKMNDTLDSIKEYKTHFDSFKIPEELILFFQTYVNNEIQPVYQGLDILINKKKEKITLEYLQIYSKYYENIYKFINKKEKTYSLIDIIVNEINSYGKSEYEYKNKLENEINRIERRNIRRLNEEETDEDISEDYKEKTGVKSVDENFHNLFNSIKNTIKIIQTDEYFDKLVEKIEQNINKLNISYKDSENIIENLYKEGEIYSILKNKLEYLYNLSINYYKEIKDNYNSFRKYIEKSLIEINDLISRCVNITYKTLADKYEEISNDSEEFDIEQDKIEENINKIEYTSISQNSEYKTVIDIKYLVKKVRFKYPVSTEEEGNNKMPKFKASIINQIKPQKINLEINSPFGYCGRNTQRVEVEFNKVNYTTIINIDTRSTLINITTITDFDDYQYNVKRYIVEDSYENICGEFLGILLCIEEKCNINNIKMLEEPVMKIKNKVTKEETISIEV